MSASPTFTLMAPPPASPLPQPPPVRPFSSDMLWRPGAGASRPSLPCSCGAGPVSLFISGTWTEDTDKGGIS